MLALPLWSLSSFCEANPRSTVAHRSSYLRAGEIVRTDMCWSSTREEDAFTRTPQVLFLYSTMATLALINYTMTTVPAILGRQRASSDPGSRRTALPGRRRCAAASPGPAARSDVIGLRGPVAICSSGPALRTAFLAGHHSGVMRSFCSTRSFPSSSCRPLVGCRNKCGGCGAPHGAPAEVLTRSSDCGTEDLFQGCHC